LYLIRYGADRGLRMATIPAAAPTKRVRRHLRRLAVARLLHDRQPARHRSLVRLPAGGGEQRSVGGALISFPPFRILLSKSLKGSIPWLFFCHCNHVCILIFTLLKFSPQVDHGGLSRIDFTRFDQKVPFLPIRDIHKPMKNG